MPDVSRLDDFAREQRLRYEWKTWRSATHWHAEVSTFRGGQPFRSYRTSQRSTEQDVLDYAIELVIRGPFEHPPEKINVRDGC